MLNKRRRKLVLICGAPRMERLTKDAAVENGIWTKMYKELAQYVVPKKAVEVSGEEAGPVLFKISWAES